MRTRIIPKMLNDEVEEYLTRNDIVIVPVGTVEMHGGFPLDSETVVSEAFALKMAEACDGLVLTGLPYFYAGATASGRGTVQVSIQEGIRYLTGIAESLLRQGFKRQIYISAHGPAHMTVSPMVRDFMDKTGTPILYMDMIMQLMRNGQDVFKSADTFHAITVGAYDMLGRLEDVPLTTKYEHQEKQSCAEFDDVSKWFDRILFWRSERPHEYTVNSYRRKTQRTGGRRKRNNSGSCGTDECASYCRTDEKSGSI